LCSCLTGRWDVETDNNMYPITGFPNKYVTALKKYLNFKNLELTSINKSYQEQGRLDIKLFLLADCVSLSQVDYLQPILTQPPFTLCHNEHF